MIDADWSFTHSSVQLLLLLYRSTKRYIIYKINKRAPVSNGFIGTRPKTIATMKPTNTVAVRGTLEASTVWRRSIFKSEIDQSPLFRAFFLFYLLFRKEIWKTTSRKVIKYYNQRRNFRLDYFSLPFISRFAEVAADSACLVTVQPVHLDNAIDMVGKSVVRNDTFIIIIFFFTRKFSFT